MISLQFKSVNSCARAEVKIGWDCVFSTALASVIQEPFELRIVAISLEFTAADLNASSTSLEAETLSGNHATY